MTCPTLPQAPLETNYGRTNFDRPQLGLDWNYVQVPDEDTYEISLGKGTLALKGSAVKIGEKESPTFVGRRLTDIQFEATTRVEFNPKNENEEAGMALLNNGSHFDIMVYSKQGKRYVVVKMQFGQTVYKSKEIALEPGSFDLKIEGTGPEFIFSYSQNNNDFEILETADARFLSTQTVGWFTRLYVGMYATGNGKQAKAPAVFDWFEYRGK